MDFPIWLEATFWGAFAGFALFIGAFIGYFCNLQQRLVAGIMAFGSGVLISALAFELTLEAFNKGGLLFTVAGFLLGSLLYSLANFLVSKYGAKNRKRSNVNDDNSSGLSIAVGALIDGIPESIVIGIGMVEGGVVSGVAVAAIFISNIPEGLSSSVGMKKLGKSFSYVALIWLSIAVISAFSAFIGYWGFANAPISLISFIMAVAAGAILSMIIDTMIPEAFEETHNFAGFITVLGFLCAFVLRNI